MDKFKPMLINAVGDIKKIDSEKYFITIINLVTSFFLLVIGVLNFVITPRIELFFIALVGSLLFAILYYLVRFKNQLFFSKISLTIIGLILLDIAFFLKDFSNGSVLYFIMIYGALIIWVWEGMGLILAVTYYFLNIIVLLTLELNTIHILIDYSEQHIRTLDIFANFFMYSALLILLLYVIKQDLIRQKDLVDKANELYVELVNSTPVGLYQTTSSGKILSVNKALIKMLKYDSLEDLLQRDLSHGSYVENKKREEFKKTLHENGKITDFESEWFTKNGEIIMVLENAKTILDKKGEIIRYDGTVQDITEKNKTEKALIKAKEIAEKSEKRLLEAQKLAHMGSWELDLIANSLTWSDEIFRIFGYNPQGIEVSYKGFLEFVHPEDRDYVNNAYQEHLISQVPYNIIHRLLLKDGQIKYVNEKCETEFDNQGNAIRSIGTVADITENIRVQQELLIAKEQAEESNRLKSAFLANMSHEIRTPMSGILGFSELLKNPELKSEKQEKYIKIIEKSGKRLLTTINDIIDISKIESGLVEVNISEVNINHELEELIEFFKAEADKKGISLVLNNNLKNEQALIKTDAFKLNGIFTNLIKNAIKYTKKGNVEVGCSINENNLEFYVKDTGIGIPKDRQIRIFDRFVQADIEDKAAYQGSGLGLAIVKAYVEMLAGKIWLESTEGKGSEFYVSLPINNFTEKIKEPKNEEVIINLATQTKNLKILIVEDNDFAQLFLTEILDELSKDILMANNGTKAVELVKQNPDIDIIMMDIKLPDFDGYEATRQIRAFNKEVFIIAQTSYAFFEDKEKALSVGCNDYISKPFNKKLLYEIMNKYIHQIIIN